MLIYASSRTKESFWIINRNKLPKSGYALCWEFFIAMPGDLYGCNYATAHDFKSATAYEISLGNALARILKAKKWYLTDKNKKLLLKLFKETLDKIEKV